MPMEQPPSSSLGLALPVAELPTALVPPVAVVAPPIAALVPPAPVLPPVGATTSARAVPVKIKKDIAASAPSNLEVLMLLSPFRGQRWQYEASMLNAQQAQTKEHANSTDHDPN